MRTPRRLEPYLYLLPATLFLLVIFAYPIFQVLNVSLQQIDADGGRSFGFANYQQIFDDPVFWQAAGNNAKLILTVPIMTILALIIALLLFERAPGWRLHRALIFLPYIMPVPVVATTFVYLLGLKGILNTTLNGIGLGALTQDWLGSAQWVLPAISAVIIYRELGFGVVLFLARLMSLDEEVLEAARINGANWWETQIFVTIPQLASIIEFFVVVELITMLSWVFAYVYTMTGGGPGFSSTIMELYIWKHAFTFRSPGLASALAVILLATTTLLIVVQLRLRRESMDNL